MKEPNEEPGIPQLDQLRAPPRDEADRQRTRRHILDAAEPLLLRRALGPTSFDVLARWARPGLAAAAIATALLAAALWRNRAPEPAPEPTAVAQIDAVLLAAPESGPVPAILVALNEPNADAAIAAALQRSEER